MFNRLRGMRGQSIGNFPQAGFGAVSPREVGSGAGAQDVREATCEARPEGR